jgi:hypothetical protein
MKLIYGTLRFFAQIILGLTLAWFGSWGFRVWWIPYADSKYIGHVFAIFCVMVTIWLTWRRFQKIASTPLNERTDETPISANSLTISAFVLIPFAYFFGYVSIGNAICALTTWAIGDPYNQVGIVAYADEGRGRGSSWCKYEMWIDTNDDHKHFCIEEDKFREFTKGDQVVLEGRKTKLGFKILEIGRAPADLATKPDSGKR